ncbi:hypothetical protein CDL15_Pgr017007 [Punica granatum]|uniref:Uncharacterized protein n=1 Tax=Punica granatum TaxID=22663 RepID=A0A218WYL9_PUNGR|nr:hypothetical protein CDL15_Pgr017007 [Punica granatum]
MVGSGPNRATTRRLSSWMLAQQADETANKANEALYFEAVVPFETTGDPAQDMLNLLLGPLLKKRVDKDEKEDELLTSSMSFTEEFSQKQTTDGVRETIPQAKKKTSLKDKIAMFLE